MNYGKLQCGRPNKVFFFIIAGSVGSGKYPGGEVGCTMIMDSEDFVRMFQGHLNPLQLSMLDRLEIKGHKVLALHIPRLMGKVKSKL